MIRGSRPGFFVRFYSGGKWSKPPLPQVLSWLCWVLEEMAGFFIFGTFKKIFCRVFEKTNQFSEQISIIWVIKSLWGLNLQLIIMLVDFKTCNFNCLIWNTDWKQQWLYDGSGCSASRNDPVRGQCWRLTARFVPRQPSRRDVFRPQVSGRARDEEDQSCQGLFAEVMEVLYCILHTFPCSNLTQLPVI